MGLLSQAGNVLPPHAKKRDVIRCKTESDLGARMAMLAEKEGHKGKNPPSAARMDKEKKAATQKRIEQGKIVDSRQKVYDATSGEPTTIGDIADIAGTSRYTAGNWLRQLATEGLVERKKGSNGRALYWRPKK